MLRKKSLQVELKDTLQDAPLVLNPVSLVLNREETLSVQDKVLACNTPEVDLLQHAGGQNLRVSDNVYVLFLNRKRRISDELVLVVSRIIYLLTTLFCFLKKGVNSNFSYD